MRRHPMNEIEEARDYLWKAMAGGTGLSQASAIEWLVDVKVRAVMAEGQKGDAPNREPATSDRYRAQAQLDPPVSEPVAQGRAFKVGDRVRIENESDDHNAGEVLSVDERYAEVR